MRVVSTLGLALILAACGGATPSPDAGSMDGGLDGGPVRVDATPLCDRDQVCRDDRFCNGIERCLPGDPGADSSGCVPGTPPCTAQEVCNEVEQSCQTDACGDGGDADMDGDRRPGCGGGDCDDGDSRVSSLNREVCDDDGLDEDCDSGTIHNDRVNDGFGDGDQDRDGYVDRRCFNRRVDGTENRGTDCDDASLSVNPGALEACNGVDDDCNVAVDEDLPTMRCYRDEDGDGYGLSEVSEMRCACADGWAALPGDCADRTLQANPMATWREGGWCESTPDVPCVIGGRSGDWNCDGVQERRYPIRCADVVVGCSPLPDCSRCGGCWDETRVPSCDEPAMRWRQWNADCTQTTTTRRQECR